MRAWFSLVFVALMGIAGCASLSEEACLEGAWNDIGVRDGAAGRTAQYLENHREACADVDVVPDQAAWEAGRKVGLRTYCTPETAYSVGRKGRKLSPVCPTEVARSLTAPNDHGLRYYEIGRDIDDLERRLRDIDARLSHPKLANGPGRASLLSARNQVFLRITALQARQIRYSRWPPA